MKKIGTLLLAVLMLVGMMAVASYKMMLRL